MSRQRSPAVEPERVVAVVLGGAAHDHDEDGFEVLLQVDDRQRCIVRALQRHVVEPDLRRVGGRDLVGALVDHPEAHVFEHRHALGERDRAAVAPHLQADAALLVPVGAVEIDGERAGRRQPLDHADVFDRGERRIDLAIAVGEGVAILREQHARLGRLARLHQRLVEPVGPAHDDAGHHLLQRGARHARRLSLRASDDEMHAHQRAFREERKEGADAALVHLGEIVADRPAHLAVVAIARRHRRARTRSDRSGRAAPARARADARRAAGWRARSGKACPRRAGTARRADRYRARWRAPCRNGPRDRSRRARARRRPCGADRESCAASACRRSR